MDGNNYRETQRETSDIGTLYLCATPIGNLEDITLRVLNTLRGVDLIAAEDTRNTLKLLNHYDIHRPLTSYHEHNKYEKADELIAQLRAGKDIALVTDAGTPVISDPGEVLAARCIEQGIRVTSLPGACALITALTMSGMPARRFVFEGFLPVDKKERARILESLKDEERTIILYEAPHRLRRTLQDLNGVLSGESSMAQNSASSWGESYRELPAGKFAELGGESSAAKRADSARTTAEDTAGAKGVGAATGRCPEVVSAEDAAAQDPAATGRRITICRELTKRYEEALPMTLPEAIAYYHNNEPRGEYVLILEGADPERKKACRQAAWMEMSIGEHMDYYETQGIGHKEAMKLVAKDRGVPKRDIYRALIPEDQEE